MNGVIVTALAVLTALLITACTARPNSDASSWADDPTSVPFQQTTTSLMGDAIDINDLFPKENNTTGTTEITGTTGSTTKTGLPSSTTKRTTVTTTTILYENNSGWSPWY